jgi:hypothetical protein
VASSSALAGRAVALFEMAVEIPDAIDEFGDRAGAAEIGGEFVDADGGDFVVEDIAEPAHSKSVGWNLWASSPAIRTGIGRPRSSWRRLARRAMK